MSLFPYSIKKQSGVTLIELMIAMTLGLILTGSLITVFIGSKTSYRLQSGMAQMQAGGRAVVDLLSEDLMMAGYPQSAAFSGFLIGQTQEGEAENDQIGIRYESDIDCLGATTPTYGDGKQYAKHVYYIGNNDLRCRTLDANDDELQDLVIVEGVEHLQILYGIDGVADGENSATRYVNADNVTDWDEVVSIRFAVLVNSLTTISDAPDTATFNLLNQIEVPAANDSLRRRQYSATVVVRNNRG